MRNWSRYQLDVFKNIASGTGHTVVKAVAGSGKSTTILEALTHVPTGCRTLFVAFNKAIAEELTLRAPKTVEVSTLHSYGLKTITRSLGRLKIDLRRADNLLREMYPTLETTKVVNKILKEFGEEPSKGLIFDLQRDITKTVSLAKGNLACEEKQIERIVDDFEIESPNRPPIPELRGLEVPEAMLEAFRAAFVKDSLALLLRCADVSDGTIDFDDMIWLPIVLELNQTKFDRVFVDETQDLNPAQIEMTFRAVKTNGRICAVGDPRQAIYRFRGADEAAVDNVVKRLDATILPLSVCYRCCRSVVQAAQSIVPEIESAPGAEEGTVKNVTRDEMMRDAGPGHFILSRVNAPLISLCMKFLMEGRPATIQGRDIGASLSAFVKKSAARSVDELRSYVEEWRDVECKRLSEKRRDTQSVEDRAECILALSDGARTVSEVVGRIERLFVDKDDSTRIVLSSTHKAKGMERDTVWMLQWTYGRKPGVEEENLIYVAQTRARKTLFMVQK